MPRRFRLWEKKRGDRITGSRFIGSAGEAVFFAALAVFGGLTITALMQTGILDSNQDGSVSVWGWFATIVLAALICIGLAGAIYTLMLSRTSTERRRALAKKATGLDLLADRRPSTKDYPNVPRGDNLTNSPGIKLAYRLPIEQWPGWRVLVVGAFSLFWNALVGLLIWLHWTGEADLYLTSLTISFAALGIASIVFFVYLIMRTMAIGPTSLEISGLPVFPNETYQVFLTQAGRLSVKQLTVTLVCEEEATFRQGTDTRTEIRRVHQQEVFSKYEFEIEPSAPFEFQGELKIPCRKMHSFQSDHNAVHWKFVVTGVFEKWPEFERSFPIVVFPVQLVFA